MHADPEDYSEQAWLTRWVFAESGPLPSLGHILFWSGFSFASALPFLVAFALGSYLAPAILVFIVFLQLHLFISRRVICRLAQRHYLLKSALSISLRTVLFIGAIFPLGVPVYTIIMFPAFVVFDWIDSSFPQICVMVFMCAILIHMAISFYTMLVWVILRILYRSHAEENPGFPILMPPNAEADR